MLMSLENNVVREIHHKSRVFAVPLKISGTYAHAQFSGILMYGSHNVTVAFNSFQQ